MGRVLTFADRDVVRLAKENFVAVTGDDWYQRRRQDAEGEFFRSVADQGPRKGKGGGTRQGMYIFTADGKLLAYRNHEDPQVMRGELQKALKVWQRLPAKQRQPGAVKVDDWSAVDERYERKLPQDGLVVNVFTRILKSGDDGAYAHTTCKFTGGERAAHDHLWVPAEEWHSLVGDEARLVERLAMRISRFHLVDNTRGEPPAWSREQVRKRDVKVTVVEKTPQCTRLRLEGFFILATQVDPGQADRGFEANLLGYVDYDREEQKITRFDLVAVGEHWGEGPYTGGARPGRQPLGVAFELCTGDQPADRVPPQFARTWQEYLAAEE